MTSWDAAVITGLVRVAAGATLIRGAGPLATFLGADDDPVVRRVLVGFGVRDVALGMSALVSSRPGRNVRRQLELQAGFDLVDATTIGFMISRGRLPRVRGALAAGTALTSAVSEWWGRSQLATSAAA